MCSCRLCGYIGIAPQIGGIERRTILKKKRAFSAQLFEIFETLIHHLSAMFLFQLFHPSWVGKERSKEQPQSRIRVQEQRGVCSRGDGSVVSLVALSSSPLLPPLSWALSSLPFSQSRERLLGGSRLSIRVRIFRQTTVFTSSKRVSTIRPKCDCFCFCCFFFLLLVQ